MTTYFISRHPGAVAWAAEAGVIVDQQLAHLDIATIQADDVVIGTLPVNLAAQVCQRGGRYLHLSLELPLEWRGRELSAADLRQIDARLQEYHILSVGSD